MSTRSNIIVFCHTEQVWKKIYCHSDGYLSYNGDLLLKHYNSAERAEAIVALGGCSFLAKELAPPEGASHGFDQRAPGVSVFYGRDRGECAEATLAPTLVELVAESLEEYVYVWWGDSWWVNTDPEEGFDVTDPTVLQRLEAAVLKDKLTAGAGT